MATVTALQSFVGVLKNDKLAPDRVEKHSDYPGAPSVFPGGDGMPIGSVEKRIVEPGKDIKVVRGQLFDSNHPAVKKWPELFGEVESVHATEPATKAVKS